MANDKRICKACGTEYNYCPTCAKYKSLPSWMWKCDTEECNELFNVITSYNMGNKTEDDIKNVIEKYNITDFSVFTKGIYNVLNEIFVNKKNKKNKRKALEMDIELVKEEPIIVTEEEPIATLEDFSNTNGISEL